MARAQVEAWTNRDFDTARAGLRPDVTFTITTTRPLPQTLELNGADDYMKGLMIAVRFTVPGSLRVAASTGTNGNAMLMVTYLVDFGSGNEAAFGAGPWKGEWTLSASRLYRLDDEAKIEAEHVTYYMTPN